MIGDTTPFEFDQAIDYKSWRWSSRTVSVHHGVSPTVPRRFSGTGSPRILTADGLFYRTGVCQDGLKPGRQLTDIFRCPSGSHMGHTRCAASVFRPKAGLGCGQPGRFQGPHRVSLVFTR
ncbi:hypothetical protein CROQUDRAFT_417979 [Cronartium quercuum f. sp. fusiforme G11]|uniref:Uncharacterized protein n=1 Tax=Cronartium quercuum f. sp. fusiforme G11 TaxID=708437 RepID=A0A9P6N5Q5_9BASI|nr:hypothetical protein CROQUDRAFT_417979 [Cronartium quercuum f. sp. fusiforme G11]